MIIAIELLKEMIKENKWLIIICVMFLCSCEEMLKNSEIAKPEKVSITIKHGDGVNSSYSYIECDSINMISINEAIIWNNGKDSRIFGGEIRVNIK